MRGHRGRAGERRVTGGPRSPAANERPRAAADGGRAEGSLAMACSQAATRNGGAEGAATARGAGWACTWAMATSMSERSSKGRWPASSSYRTTPGRRCRRPGWRGGRGRVRGPGRRAEHLAGEGGLSGGGGDAEVEHLDLSVGGQEHVARLDVAVDHPAPVGGLQGVRDRGHHPGRLRRRHHRARSIRAARLSSSSSMTR